MPAGFVDSEPSGETAPRESLRDVRSGSRADLRARPRGAGARRARVRPSSRVARRADSADGQVRPDERRQARAARRAAAWPRGSAGTPATARVLNAAVVEFIHTATLVHDDIIDGADTRRGRLTAHSRWGSDITVLLGDYLYIRSMAMALRRTRLEVVRLLCDCTLQDDRRRAVPAHQDRRRHASPRTSTSRSSAARRRFCSRGAPRSAACSATRTPEQRTALREYGFNLGIAFQIVDDVLDYMADESALGQADRRRPARRQGHAADHPAAAAHRPRRRGADPGRHRRRPGHARDVADASRTCWRRHGAVEAAFERAVDARRARQSSTCVAAFPAVARARRPRRADRLRPESQIG